MVQVYLPLGYPAMQGQVEQMLIYQGNVVRLYQVPTDPRTEAQLFERKFLADLVKMRSNLGTWGRGACKAAFGSKWGSVLYQLVKLDHDTCWSSAVATWEAFSAEQKEAWREFAPYQATYNDPGKIFCALSLSIYLLFLEYSGHDWGAESWVGGQAEECLGWWMKDLTGVIRGQKVDGDNPPIDGSPHFGAGPRVGWYNDTLFSWLPASEIWFGFYCYGRIITVSYSQHQYFGNYPIYADGKQVGTLNQYKAGQGTDLLAAQEFNLGYRGLHYVKVIGSGNTGISLDAVEVG
jgi:hypothetical protein